MGRGQSWPTQRLFDTAVIADSHLVVAQGVARLLSRVVRSVRIVGSGEELVESAGQSIPGVVISEVKMPGISGIEAMMRLHGVGNRIPFAFLTMSSEASSVMLAMRSGARAYLPKTVESGEFLRALEVVARGGSYIAQCLSSRIAPDERSKVAVLTPTQLRILQGIGNGMTTRELAAQLGISVRTVESHKYVMMQELEVHSTLELLRRARAEGLLEA